MPFSESIKLNVKRRSDFTCCWCNDRRNKVDVHHIISESEGGIDDEDNAAPLCGSCHALYGSNPDLRKEIILRRDHWYAFCAEKWEFQSSTFDILHRKVFLTFCSEIPPRIFCPVRNGIQFTETDQEAGVPSESLLKIYFKEFRSYSEEGNQESGKWLHIQARLLGFFTIGLEARARTTQDTKDFMEALRGGNSPAILNGELLGDFRESLNDYILVWPIGEVKRISIAVSSPSRSGISCSCFLSKRAALFLAEYLDKEGFSEPFT